MYSVTLPPVTLPMSSILPRIQIGIVDQQTGFGETMCHLVVKRPFTNTMLHRLVAHLQKEVIDALSSQRVIHYEPLLHDIHSLLQDRSVICYYPVESFGKGTTDAHLHFCVWHDDATFQAEIRDDVAFYELHDYLQAIQLL